MKKVILMLAIAALLVTVAGTAQAGMQWYSATITYAGSITYVDDILYISADATYDDWPGSRWFVISGSQYKVQLAIALTAWSAGKPLQLLLDNVSLTEWSPCYGLMTSQSQ